MPKYTIKIKANMKGLEQIIINDPNEYEAGRDVVILPNSDVQVQDQNGDYVDLKEYVSLSGTIISKE